MTSLWKIKKLPKGYLFSRFKKTKKTKQGKNGETKRPNSEQHEDTFGTKGQLISKANFLVLI